MIDVLSSHARAYFPEQFDAMHRLRHEVFREKLGWAVQSENGRERDQFDEYQPVYIFAHDGQDALRGSWRLLPTTGPYMLRDVFSNLLDGEPAPDAAAIWETSRLAVVSPADSERGLFSVSAICREMFCGLYEFCLLSDIKEIVSVYDVRIGRLMARMGCKPFSQTAPRKIGDTDAVAGRFAMTQEVLDHMRSSAGITGSVLRRIDIADLRPAA